MSPNRKFLLGFLALAAVAVVAWLFWLPGGQSGAAPELGADEVAQGATATGGVQPDGVKGEEGASREGDERVLEVAQRGAGLKGRVVMAESGAPVGGALVRALSRHPAFAEMELRMRDLFREGFWKRKKPKEVEVLGQAWTLPDGSFEIHGLPKGRVFLDAGTEQLFTRSYQAARLADEEQQEGLELLLSRGARVKGVVVDPDGRAASNARVILRPGVNAFLTQITARSYRWFEMFTDSEGRFDFRGVPPGQGYALSAHGAGMAPAQAREIDLVAGTTIERRLVGARGARIEGYVTLANGKPAKGATVGFAYMDLSRVLFSLDDKNPVLADDEGHFVFENVGPGHVGCTAMMDGMGLAPIERLIVVEGARLDVQLELGKGWALEGRVIDDAGKPLRAVTVAGRTMERPRGFDLSLITRLRPIEVETDKEGRFVLQGLEGNRLFVSAKKAGYIDASLRFRRQEGKRDFLELKLSRGSFITGVVRDSKERPLSRFRVRIRPASERRVGFGPRWGRMRRRPNPYQDRSPWRRGGEDEISNPGGRFRQGPFAAGKYRVTVEAAGYLKPGSKEAVVELGKDSEELSFSLERGATLRGRVVTKLGQKPVPDAQVTWRADRSGRQPGFLPFRIEAEPEDLDFMSLSSAMGTRSAITDSKGHFTLEGVPYEQKLRVTARHPSFAKVSVKDLQLHRETAPQEILLAVELGGGIEGHVRGLDRRPVKNTMVAALSIAKGVMKSATTDANGHYKIEALVPGPYMVFKTRMDALSPALMQQMLGNLRMKATTVRAGKFTKLDIEDRTRGGIDVFGTVTSNGKPCPSAVVTLLGQDRSGPLGIGLRTGTADKAGRYEIASVMPGSYLAQITDFSSGGRPQRASVPVTVADGGTRVRLDLEFPSAELIGRVVGPDGKALSGVELRALAEDGEKMPGGLIGMISQIGGASRTRSGKDGSFRLRRLPPGNWTLRANPRGSLRDTHASAELGGISVSGGQSVQGLRIVLPAACSIEGTIRDGLGRPVVAATVRATADAAKDGIGDRGGQATAAAAKPGSKLSAGTLRKLMESLRGTARTDANGRYRIRGLAPGVWNVEAEKKGLSTSRKPGIVARVGAPATLDLTMLRGGHVMLKVTGIDGKTLPRGQVRVLDSKGQEVGKKRSLMSVFATLFRRRSKDKSAWLDMGTLPPDTYTLEVRKKGKDGKESVRRTTRRLEEGEEAKWEIRMRDLIR